MSKEFIKKNLKLSLEFDTYAAKHPAIYNKIPYNGWIVLTIAGDEKFNTISRSLIADTKVKKTKVVEAHKIGSRWQVQPLSVK